MTTQITGVVNDAASSATNVATKPGSVATQHITTLPQDLVDEMQGLFGKHYGYRTTHAKGLLVEGTFTPTEQAKSLSIAPHFNNASTPVVCRFSVGGGLPQVPDMDNKATPKGLAIRFQNEDNTYSDMISHSFNGFATRNGEDFLAFLKIFRTFSIAQVLAQRATGDDLATAQANLKRVKDVFFGFIKDHPSTAVFVNGPRPNPFNYGTITYYEPNTHVLTNKDGKATNVRYRLDPLDGEHLYTDDQLTTLGNNYLEDDLQHRFPSNPIVLTIQAQIANPDDILDDATVPYKSTTFIPIGKLEINKVSDNNAARQKDIAFSPRPESGGIKGIVSSSDPLIQARKGVYEISSSQRRAETQVE